MIWFCFPIIKVQKRQAVDKRSRWDSNPQSPAPEASALSIRPRDHLWPLNIVYIYIIIFSIPGQRKGGSWFNKY